MLKMLRTFYRFVAKNRPLYVLFVIVIIFSSVSSSVIPYFYKLFINNLTSRNFSIVIYILIAYVGVRFFSLALEILSSLLADTVLKESSTDARATIFRHIQKLDFSFHTNKSTGALISAFKRGDGAFFNLFHNIHQRIVSIFIGFLVMLYFFTQIDILIGACAVVSFIIMLFLAKIIVKKNVAARNLFNAEEDKVSGVIADNLIGYETVKLFAKEDWEYQRLNKLFVNWKRRLWDYGISFRFFDISLGSVINISIFLTLLLALNLYSRYSLEVGDVVLIVGFIDTFYPRVFDLVWSFREIAKNYADIEKYFGILDYKIELKESENPKKLNKIKGEVEFKNLGFSYKEGKANAVRSINLKIRQGQSVALVGRSGSGKTTLVKLLMRFYDPDKGSITIDDIDLRDISKNNLRSIIGVVPQEPILFNNTISYNIAYGKTNSSLLEIKAAAKIANIDTFIESLPKKYYTNVGERGIKLSGGQKQRLAIARMVLSNPQIIIFDEATSQLDSESEGLIQDAFWKVTKNKTTIIIAHRLSTVIKADEIVVMDEGKIIEKGSHKALIAQKDSLYSHFWDLQTKDQDYLSKSIID